MMSQRTMHSWYIIITTVSVLGILDQFFNIMGGMLIFLLYMTIGILDEVGFFVWKQAPNGWSWPEPNAFGYALSITFWFVLFYVMAELTTPAENKTSKDEKST